VAGSHGGYITGYKEAVTGANNWDPNDLGTNATTFAHTGLTTFYFDSVGTQWPAGLSTIQYNTSAINTIYTAFKIACDNQGSGEIFFRVFESDQPNQVNYYKFPYNDTTATIGSTGAGGLIINNVEYIGGSNLSSISKPVIGWGLPGSGGGGGGRHEAVSAPGTASRNAFIPQRVDDAMQVPGGGGFLTTYEIGINVRDNTYLPGGDWAAFGSRNHLPEECNSFVFLKVNADMTNLGIPDRDVFIPCYFAIP